MTYAAVDDLPEEAASILLGVCTQLSQSRHPGLAGWAASASDALLVRLVRAATGAVVDVSDIQPPRPFATLDGAELEALYALLVAGSEASDDESVAQWCTRTVGLIDADFYRRADEQAAIDAKAAAIIAEERRLARQEWQSSVAPWSAV